MWQQRNQAQTNGKNDCSNITVEASVQVKKCTDYLRIIFRNRFIHAVDKCTSNSQFSQTKETQNRCKQAVETKILRAKNVKQNGSNNKREQHIEKAIDTPYIMFRLAFVTIDFHIIKTSSTVRFCSALQSMRQNSCFFEVLLHFAECALFPRLCAPTLRRFLQVCHSCHIFQAW